MILILIHQIQFWEGKQEIYKSVKFSHRLFPELGLPNDSYIFYTTTGISNKEYVTYIYRNQSILQPQ
jgi:hypothetical protein